MQFIQAQLTSQRLILKQVTAADYAIYQQILSSDELTKYLPKGRAHTEQETKQHFANRVQHWHEHGFGSYVIFAKDNPDTAIGYVGVEVCPKAEYSDIRYAILPSEQGKGYVFEASEKVLEATFELDKHNKIFGASLPDNHASVHLLKKLGMQADTMNPYGMNELLCFSLAKS